MKRFIDFTEEILKNEHTQTLRILGREMRLKSPTTKSKDQLIKEIIARQKGELAPQEPSRKGAPTKTDTAILSKFLIEDIPYVNGVENPGKIVFNDSDKESFVTEGVLEILNGNNYGFLRVKNYDVSSKDIYVSGENIKKFGLRKGDYVSATAKRNENADAPALVDVIKINDVEFRGVLDRPNFDDLTSKYPDVKFNLNLKSNDYDLRCIDLFSPIGKGQRGIIVAPPKTGKTTLIKKVATAIETNHKDVKLFVLLIDERPEEVNDFRRSVLGEVISSTFDAGYERHVKVSELVLNRAKRLVEMGKDVVIVMDSITRLARAYNNVITPSGRTLSGGLDPMALQAPKRFFGSARALEQGGSLTIISTALIDTESRMDEVIYEEFKGTGNMELHLDRNLAENRVFPAINVLKSGTRKEELLLSKDTLDGAYKIRRALSGKPDATQTVLGLMEKTESNDQLIAKFKA